MLTVDEAERVERWLLALPVRERMRIFYGWMLEDPDWQAQPDWIYAIRVGDYGGDVKIGVSRDPLRRLAELQTSNSETLVGLGSWPARPGDERMLHERYAGLRLRGEWFMHSLPMMRLIRDFNSGMHW